MDAAPGPRAGGRFGRDVSVQVIADNDRWAARVREAGRALALDGDYRMTALLRTWIDAGALPEWLFERPRPAD